MLLSLLFKLQAFIWIFQISSSIEFSKKKETRLKSADRAESGRTSLLNRTFRVFFSELDRSGYQASDFFNILSW